MIHTSVVFFIQFYAYSSSLNSDSLSIVVGISSTTGFFVFAPVPFVVLAFFPGFEMPFEVDGCFFAARVFLTIVFTAVAALVALTCSWG